jgi:hypothetical protein
MGTRSITRSTRQLQIQPRRTEEIQVLGVAMTKVESRQGCPAGQDEALLAREERLQQVDLQGREATKLG